MVKKHTLRAAAAFVGASAVIAMAALSVVAGGVQAQANTVVPEHFGGPVNTSVYNPTATLGIPTLSSTPKGTPAPLNAPG